MPLAIVKTEFAPLYAAAQPTATLQDEVLFGMAVEVLSAPAPGWLLVRTACHCEGFVEERCLATDGAAAKEWAALGKMAARAPFVDVLNRPAADGSIVCTVPRGALLHPTGAENDDGWLPVSLPGGGQGHVKSTNLMPHYTGYSHANAEGLREALAATAMSYLGTQYRFGGKTPLGIDCGGLVSMAYLLNGAVIWRGGQYREGFDTHLIGREALGRGDLLYFGEHAAMYLGDDMYIHASGKNGSDGVVLNSLREGSPFYRADLAGNLTACASLF